MAETGIVRFHNAGILRERSKVKRFLVSLFKKEGRRLASLDYILCSDEELLQINREFLKHDYFTDIITFNLSDSQEITGEVYISVDRVRENSRSFKTTLKEELHRVIFHGALHLCGYKDKSVADKQEMRKKEEECLELYLK